MNRFLPGALALLLVSLAGCATSGQHRMAALPLTGDPVRDADVVLQNSPPRDRALIEYRTAIVAMRRGEYTVAKRLLDDAILTLGGVLHHDKDARHARNVFAAESKKKFIGEPYERVMAYYYRGILYWMDGEPDNARACFRSAQIHDADTDNKEYAADYVLLDYLDGLATAKLAGDGSDAFKRAEKEARIYKPGVANPRANLLVFVEYGGAPVKYATGEFQEQLRFREGTSIARSATVRVGAQALLAPPFDDLYFQATTRGGRVMDHILANKAVFKSATDTAGNVALVSGLVLSQQRDTREAALGLAAFGLVSKLISAASTPAADTRTWDNLPQYLSFTSAVVPAGAQTVTVEFRDASGNVLPNLTKTVTVNVPAGQDRVLFVSDKSVTPQTL